MNKDEQNHELKVTNMDVKHTTTTQLNGIKPNMNHLCL